MTSLVFHEAPHLKIHFGTSCGDDKAERWNINSTITLAKDEELIASEVWEFDKETLQGFEIISSDLREHLTWLLIHYIFQVLNK